MKWTVTMNQEGKVVKVVKCGCISDYFFFTHSLTFWLFGTVQTYMCLQHLHYLHFFLSFFLLTLSCRQSRLTQTIVVLMRRRRLPLVCCCYNKCGMSICMSDDCKNDCFRWCIAFYVVPYTFLSCTRLWEISRAGEQAVKKQQQQELQERRSCQWRRKRESSSSTHKISQTATREECMSLTLWTTTWLLTSEWKESP